MTIGNALDYLTEGALIQLNKYNGDSIGVELPMYVELVVAHTQPGVRRFVERHRDQAGQARNRPRDPRSPLY